MTVTVFDTIIPIKNQEGHPNMNESLLKKLDEMLNTHYIAHAFTLPTDEQIQEDDSTTLMLCYENKDDMEVCLIYALFCKKYRNSDNKDVAECLVKIASRFVNAE